jgi:hypothetical protein
MTRGVSRWSHAMVVGQLAATVVLVFACGLLVRSFASLTNVDRGFDHDQLYRSAFCPHRAGTKT